MAMGLSEDRRERVPRLSVGGDVPMHPALTDVPVATSTLAPVFDAISLIAGSPSAGAAGLWTGAAAVLWSLPTAASGVLDYVRAPVDSPVKGIGRRHAALNSAALGLMAGSLAARRFRAAPTPVSLALSAAAGAAVAYSSYLGGLMVYREGMRVRETEEQPEAADPVDEWEPAALTGAGGAGDPAIAGDVAEG